MSIVENIAAVREKINAAALRTGRNPSDITLIAVSKTFPAENIREAYGSSLRIFGESRVQEFTEKAAALNDLQNIDWRMIGHLQTNKAAKAAELFHAVDSLDSLRLAEKLNSAAEELGKKLPVLIEINVGGEAAKTGIAPDSQELENILQAASRLTHLEIRGLMTVPPFTENPEGARPIFQRLRQLRDQIAARNLPSVSMKVLSMG